MDQHGQIIDVFISKHRDTASARRSFTTSLTAHGEPVEVITDRVRALTNVIDDLIPAAFHNTGEYANNRCEADHGRLKTRLRSKRGLKTDRTASDVTGGHATWNRRRGQHYELGAEVAPVFRLATAFDETPIRNLNMPASLHDHPRPTITQCKSAPTPRTGHPRTGTRGSRTPSSPSHCSTGASPDTLVVAPA